MEENYWQKKGTLKRAEQKQSVKNAVGYNERKYFCLKFARLYHPATCFLSHSLLQSAALYAIDG